MKFDVKTAFLCGDIDKEIYLEQPEGYINKKKPTHVLKLLRGLYGLKQAPRCWNKKFVEFLMKFNFKSFGGKKCVFFFEINGVLVYLAIYGIVFGTSGSLIKIQGFSDSDYAGCLETRRSRFLFCQAEEVYEPKFYYAQGLICNSLFPLTCF